MITSSYRYLQFTNLKDISNWSVQYADGEHINFGSKYPLVRIDSFLVKSKDFIEIEDYIEYRQVTVKINNGGVIQRNNGKSLCGSKIGTKRQTVVHAGQFIMSKIDARNGAYGIVPQSLEGAIVTNDFPVFDVDVDKIIPQFLVLISTSEKFIEFARKCSSGTTNRKRIDIDAFLSQLIPLPSIEEQRDIMNRYNKIISDAEEKEKEIGLCDQKILCFLQKELNITESAHSKKDNQFLHFSSLSQIHRWDCYNIPYRLSDNRNVKTLSQIIKSKPFYGASYSAVKYDGKVRYIRITDINEDGSLSKVKVSANAYSDTYLLKENDFLIARSGNTVGKTFLYTHNVGRAIFAGYLIKFELNEQMVDPRYVLIYTKSPMFKKWIHTNMRVSAQPNINCKQYLDAPIIVPKLHIQKRIVEYANKLYVRKNALQFEADYLRREAINFFKEIIFE